MVGRRRIQSIRIDSGLGKSTFERERYNKCIILTSEQPFERYRHVRTAPHSNFSKAAAATAAAANVALFFCLREDQWRDSSPYMFGTTTCSRKKMSARRDGKLKVADRCVNNTHSGTALFPRTRTFFVFCQKLALPRLDDPNLELCLRVKKVSVVAVIPQSVARCHSRTTQTIRRTSPSALDGNQVTVDNWTYLTSHSRTMNPFGCLAEQASVAGYEPNVQLDDMTSNNFASMQGDSELSSTESSSSTCSVTDYVATRTPASNSTQSAPKNRL